MICKIISLITFPLLLFYYQCSPCPTFSNLSHISAFHFSSSLFLFLFRTRSISPDPLLSPYHPLAKSNLSFPYFLPLFHKCSHTTVHKTYPSSRTPSAYPQPTKSIPYSLPPLLTTTQNFSHPPPPYPPQHAESLSPAHPPSPTPTLINPPQPHPIQTTSQDTKPESLRGTGQRHCKFQKHRLWFSGGL